MARILLAEDDDSMRDFLAKALKRAGHEVISCADGDEGLSVFEGQPDGFDLLLTDIVMPGIDGIELARVLRNQEATKDIPIIALSTKAEDMLNAETRRQFAAYLVKPFGLDELPRIVHDILGGVGAAQ